MEGFVGLMCGTGCASFIKSLNCNPDSVHGLQVYINIIGAIKPNIDDPKCTHVREFSSKDCHRGNRGAFCKRRTLKHGHVNAWPG